MEMAMWKKLMLTWVNASGLLEKPAKFLDQTDLPGFYAEYRKLMVRVSIQETDIRDFLRVHYPSFRTHLHTLDDNEICTTDYVYIYCLLLHFSCVVCKEEIFQSICMKMSSTQQEFIALLFSRLVQSPITREMLKIALKETAAPSAIEFMQLESPIRTPRKPSPATPATKLLDERSRELISLKALLETERYERNFLEVQMKEIEEKLNRANQQQKNHILEIKQLKEKLLYGDEQNIPQNREKKEVFSLANHHREVKHLEDKIWSLNNEVELMTRERNGLKQKNALIEKELSNFREKCHEQRILNENINAELEEKLRLIADLESDNEELKMFIKEKQTTRQDLNSTDSLDYSFNSSNTKHDESPESLAKTVVDVQLREKECENQMLRSSLAAKQEEQLKLSQEIVAFMRKHAAAMEAEVPKIIANDDNLQYVAFTFMTATEKLVEKETEMQRTLRKAEQEQESLVDTIARLNDQCARMKGEMAELVEQEKGAREDLSKAHESLERKSQKINNLSREFQELRAEYENAKKELSCEKTVNQRYEEIIEENEATEKELAREVGHLKSKIVATEKDLDETKRKIGVLQKKLSESEEEMKEKENSLEKSQASIQMLSSQNSILTTKVSDLNSAIAILQQTKESQNDEISQLRGEIEQQTKENEQLTFEKEELKAEVEAKVQDMKDLSEINENSSAKIISLEQSIEELRKEVESVAVAKENLNKDLEKLQQDNEKLSAEKIRMSNKVKDAENQIEDLKNEITNFEEQEIAFSKQIDSLKMEIELSKSNSRKNQAKKEELLKQIDEQKIQLIHLQKEIDCNKLDIETLREMLKEKDALLDETKGSQAATLEEIVKKKSDLEEALKHQQNQIWEAREEIAKSAQQGEDSMRKLHELVLERVAQEKAYEVLQGEHQKNLEELQKLTEDYKKAEEEAEKFAKISEKVESLTTTASKDIFEQLQDIQEQFVAKDNSIHDLVNKIDRMDQEASTFAAKISINEEKISELYKEIQKNAQEKKELLKNHTEELTSLQRALSETYKKNEDLSQSLQDTEASRKKVEELLEAEKAAKMDFEAKLYKEVNELEALAEKLSLAEVSESQLKEELQSTREDLAERKKHCAKLVSEIGELREEKEKEVNLLNEQLSQQKSEIAALQGEKEFLYKLKIKAEEQEAKVEELEASERELKVKMTKLSQEASEKEILVEELKQTLQEKEKDLKAIEEDLKKVIAEGKSLNEELKEKTKKLEQEASEKEILVQELKQSLLEKEKDLKRIEEEFKNEISNGKSLNEELKEKTVQLNQEVSEKEILVEELKKSLEEKENLLKTIKEEFKNEISNGKDLNEELKEKTVKLNQELSEKEILTQELQQSLLEKENLLKTIEKELKNEISNEKSLSEALKKENETLEKKISDMNDLQENLSRLQGELTAKEASNSTLTEEISKLNDLLSAKMEEVEKLTGEFEKSGEENKTKDEEYSREISKLSEEIENLRGSLEERTAEIARMEEDRKVVNEHVKELVETQKVFETKCAQYEDRVQLLSESKTKAIDVLQKEITGLERRNIELSEKMKSLEGSLVDKMTECSVMQEENAKLREEIQSIEFQNDEITQKLLDHDGEVHDLQNEIKKLLTAKHEVEKSLSKVSEKKAILDETLAQKDAEILNMKIEMGKKSTEFTADSDKIATLLKEIEKYKSVELDVRKLENLERKEKELNEKLVNDIAILQAKLFKERNALEMRESEWAAEREELRKKIAESVNADERVNETRREMEGKLEKMKEKMKMLCNAEIEKVRLKIEKEFGQKLEMAEGVNRKLSKEIAVLNSNKLDLLRENTNLRRMMGSTQTLNKPQIPQMSLDMEDEEGEQFNNTYLKDMKYGSDQPFFGRESVTKEELEYRNSMVPPHLKSQYAAQYGNLEDDATSIGDGNVHEDSMSSLLYGGQRKKVSGTTLYKRPGPPTPSKNGGRLSFGGTSDVHPRQILKDFNESKQTPSSSTLRTFFGRKSLARDETSTASPAARFRSIFRNKRTNNK
ncbi:golgin subfamily A member 4 isoform X2 [Lutzomyia longipalpis]|uniref:golgin subfamily A member 4 isoform X2 n=1 Tax=Lutzomyia longipalpis TaxID=7200 RepID=UPI002483418F|nr:golgin subfamily A member 4 isoform X2 [Lutzomyia longipalpis]